MKLMHLQKYERYGEFILDRSEQLGKGSYGTVYRGYRIRPGQKLEPIAIKEAYIIQQIMKEIKTLEILEHPNIVKYYDYREYKGHVLVFMQLCNGGNLDNLLLKYPTYQDLTRLYGQVLEGIKFMYLRNILHRDIKPSNILVKDNSLKIADFGTSKLSSAGEIYHQTLAGTPLFCSPQMLKVKMGQQKQYTEQSEIWSLGMLLYYMFNFASSAPAEERTRLSIPWFHRDDKKMLDAFSNQPLMFKNNDIPEEIKQITRRMLVVDPEKRMTFKELFSLQIFHITSKLQNNGYSENQPGEMTLQLTTINKIDIDEHLKDRLREKQEEQQSQMLYTKITREKAIFLDNLWQKIYNLKEYPQLDFLIAKLAHDLYIEYLSLASSALTCDKFRDTQNLRKLERKYPDIKQTIDKSQQTLLSSVHSFISNQAFMNNLHDQSKLINSQIEILWIIYDLLIVCTLGQHWKQRPRGLQNYYDVRKQVRAKTLINRVQQGVQMLFQNKS